MTENEKLKRAKKRVKNKKGFYTHLAIYVIVGLFFYTLNMVTWSGTLWFFFPLLPWGVGILIHYLLEFGIPFTKVLSPEWEEKELAKELKRLNKRPSSSFETSEELELKELVKRKASGWEEDDLV